jgi:hypothetical protein
LFIYLEAAELVLICYATVVHRGKTTVEGELVFMVKGLLASIALYSATSSTGFAQTIGDRVDLYFSDWHTSQVRQIRARK